MNTTETQTMTKKQAKAAGLRPLTNPIMEDAEADILAHIVRDQIRGKRSVAIVNHKVDRHGHKLVCVWGRRL